MSFKVWDTVTVIGNTSGHRFQNGDKIVVVELCSDDTLLCTNGARRFYVHKRDVASKPLEPLTEATCCGREMLKIGEAKEWEVVPLFECSVCMDIMLSNGEKLINKTTPAIRQVDVEFIPEEEDDDFDPFEPITASGVRPAPAWGYTPVAEPIQPSGRPLSYAQNDVLWTANVASRPRS